MWRGIPLGVLTVLCLVAAGGIGLAAGDAVDEGAPYVDAGLDQAVAVGDEVLLDGGGTWDDQGDITQKEWSIETPTGITIEPECVTCWFTSFRASQPGEYEVSLTVRDSEGHENEDTLYVTAGVVIEDDPAAPAPAPGPAEGDGDSAEAPAAHSGGSSGGCFMAHKAGGDHDGCSNHGTFEGYKTNEKGYTEAYIFENTDDGVEDKYSGAEINDEGQIVVDVGTVNQELDDMWDEAVEGEDSDSSGTGGSSGSSSSGSDDGSLAYAGPGLNPNEDSGGSSDSGGGGGGSSGGSGGSSDSGGGGGGYGGRCGGCHW